MLFFAILIFLMLVVFFHVSVLFCLLPILAGLLLLVICNLLELFRLERFAPLWWNLLTVLVTVISCLLLWTDIGDPALDFGFAPFLLLLGYSSLSLLITALRTMNQKF